MCVCLNAFVLYIYIYVCVCAYVYGYMVMCVYMGKADSKIASLTSSDVVVSGMSKDFTHTSDVTPSFRSDHQNIR